MMIGMLRNPRPSSPYGKVETSHISGLFFVSLSLVVDRFGLYLVVCNRHNLLGLARS